MTLPQVKKLCKEQKQHKNHMENFYLIKYHVIGWIISKPEEFTTSNKQAIDFKLYTI